MTDVETQSVAPLLLPGGAWAIDRDALNYLIAAGRQPIATSLREAVMTSERPEPRLLTAPARAASKQRVAGAVAVLPLCGPITPSGSFLSMLFGGSRGGLTGFREQFVEAVQSPDVGAIVLDIDSPGGLVSLVPETAAAIRAARGSKPIISVCNTLAASAAYWLAAQADEVVCTPSGKCGSVGVYMVHDDYSGMNEQMGVVTTYVSAGKYKTEGNADEPLSEDGQKAWQQQVDDLYSMFVEGLAEGRGVSTADVVKNYGEGRVLLAQRAQEAGMCDRQDTLETVVAELLGQEPDAAEDAKGSAGRVQVFIDGKLVAGELTADKVDPAWLAAYLADQPRCSVCGKYLATGETTCESCQEAKSEDDDDEPEAEGEPDEPDDDDDEVDDEDEPGEDGEPEVDDDEDDEESRAATVRELAFPTF